MNLSNEMLKQIIIQHYDEPDNKVDDENNLINEGYVYFHNKSATCIDDIKIYIKWENKIIVDAKFSGLGCAISTASSDIFCEMIKGKNKDASLALINEYKKMINNEEFNSDLMEELIAFREIYKQANRIRCSLIGVNAIEELLKNEK